MNIADLDTMYRETILDLYRHPLNKKVLNRFDVMHKEFNPACGDEIAVQIAFDENDIVIDIGHQGVGCAISQAAVSLLTEEVRGKTKAELQAMTPQDVFDMLGFTPVYTRTKCATIGLDAIKNAIAV